jgi:TldD protein
VFGTYGSTGSLNHCFYFFKQGITHTTDKKKKVPQARGQLFCNFGGSRINFFNLLPGGHMGRWNLQRFANKLVGDCELRAHENRSQQYQMINGQLVGNSKSSTGGLSARFYQKGAWGFASAPQISDAAADRILSQARANAMVLSSRIKPREKALSRANAQGTKTVATKKAPLSSQEILAFMSTLEDKIKIKYPKVKSRGLIVYEQDFEKELLTTSGANCYSMMARSYVRVKLSMDSAKGPVDIQEVIGGIGQIEDTWPSFDALESRLEEAYAHLKNKCSGVAPEAGVKEVILDSKLAGILAHEAIGHTTEADIVLGGSVAGDFINQKVASPLISLVDYAHTVEGKPCPLPVYFDDEGVEARDTVIIENGMLKNFMHSRESASHFGHEATGHSRAWGFNDEPLIRMRNTAILPGQSKLEEMIASVEDGYYLIDHGNGQADSTSEFMFAVTLGYEIKKGKLGRAIMDTTISGVAFDMLKTVTQVSDELTWVSSGTCGKKQPMTVGMGGPAIKCKVNLGGQ